jgi:hypothetical protein
MIELEHHLGYPYPPACVFGALADIAAYPDWQSDVLAARVSGGGLARPGAVVSMTRKVLGRGTCFRFHVTGYEHDRLLELRAAAGAWPRFQHTFRLEPLVAGECCRLSLRIKADGVPQPVEPLIGALLGHQVILNFDSLRSHLDHLRRAGASGGMPVRHPVAEPPEIA